MPACHSNGVIVENGSILLLNDNEDDVVVDDDDAVVVVGFIEYDANDSVEKDTMYDNKLNNNGGGASILALEYKYLIRGLYVPHINGTIHSII